MSARPMVRFHALIPAAGAGSRIGGETPKQYLPLAGKPMLCHAIAVLARAENIDTVFVVLAQGDEWFAACGAAELGDKVVPLYCGGV